MRPLFGLLVFAILAIHLASAADPSPDARKSLDLFYKERLKPFALRGPDAPPPKVPPTPWEASIRQLASEKPEERRVTAEYLRELLRLSLEDEHTGKAPWRATPFWGGGAENPAQDLRKGMAMELKESKPCSEVLPVLKWYLENEANDGVLDPIVAALGRLDGADTDTLRTELATKPHPNAKVTAEAIRQITSRKKTLPAETLAALCHHHRTAIRDAARTRNSQQGGKDPGPFDPTKAIRSERVAKLMEQVLRLMPDLPAANVEFVKVTVRYLDDKKTELQKKVAYGWLVKREGNTVEIYSPQGYVRPFHNKEKTKATVIEKTERGREYKYPDAVTEMTVVAATPAELVREVIERRKAADIEKDWFRSDELEAVWGRNMTLFEAIFGAWLYRAGKDADAAAIILPALESLHRDDDYPGVVGNELGELVGRKMLVSFVGDRDYSAATKHAQLINDLYPGTRFHHYATELLGQLPRRMDDFTGFKLPTSAEWSELKKTLTRDQQIDFLCERMRLLNCFQQGQPGGYDPAEKQYAEPRGLSEDASWGGGNKGTEVINPLTELTGRQEWRGEEKPKGKGLKLRIKDIPRISKYLRDDHYSLIVSFWRDFAPDRDLTRTRTIIVSIINEIAHEELCSVREWWWEKMSPAEIDKEIERINKWAEENQHKVFEEDEDTPIRNLLNRAAKRPWLVVTIAIALCIGAAALWRFVRLRRSKNRTEPDQPQGSSQ